MKSKKILVVDDDRDFAEVLTAIFSVNGLGEEVEITEDGAEALDYLFAEEGALDRIKNIPSVIFMDINMPKMDGLQALLVIRDFEEMKNTAVIMLTASTLNEDVEKAMKLGADGYLTKPVSVDILMETVRKYIG